MRGVSKLEHLEDEILEKGDLVTLQAKEGVYEFVGRMMNDLYIFASVESEDCVAIEPYMMLDTVKRTTSDYTKIHIKKKFVSKVTGIEESDLRGSYKQGNVSEVFNEFLDAVT